MIRRVSLAFLAALLACPAAFAAPEGAPQDAPPAQATVDDRSYLPPWMQSQAAGQSAPQTQEAHYGDPPVKKTTPGQHSPQSHRSHSPFGLSLEIFR